MDVVVCIPSRRNPLPRRARRREATRDPSCHLDVNVSARASVPVRTKLDLGNGSERAGTCSGDEVWEEVWDRLT